MIATLISSTRTEVGAVTTTKLAMPTELAEPDTAFLADYATSVVDRDELRFYFSKSHPFSGRATMLVEVSFGLQQFVDNVWPSIQGRFFDGVRLYCTAQRGQDWDQRIPEHLEDAVYQDRRASTMQASYAGDDAVIDFYWLSTRDMSNVIQGHSRDVRVHPVLRVVIPTCTMWRCLEVCAERIADGRRTK